MSVTELSPHKSHPWGRRGLHSHHATVNNTLLDFEINSQGTFLPGLGAADFKGKEIVSKISQQGIGHLCFKADTANLRNLAVGFCYPSHCYVPEHCLLVRIIFCLYKNMFIPQQEFELCYSVPFPCPGSYPVFCVVITSVISSYSMQLLGAHTALALNDNGPSAGYPTVPLWIKRKYGNTLICTIITFIAAHGRIDYQRLPSLYGLAASLSWSVHCHEKLPGGSSR